MEIMADDKELLDAALIYCMITCSRSKEHKVYSIVFKHFEEDIVMPK